MQLSDLLDHDHLTREYFVQSTVTADIVKIPFSEFPSIQVEGQIGNNNFVYVKSEHLEHYSSIKKTMINVQNWGGTPFDDMNIFLMSKTGNFEIRTRSSGATVIIGHNFKGSAEIRLLHTKPFIIIGDDVTAHSIRCQVHGNGIFIGRRSLFSEEVIIQGHDAHAIVDLNSDEIINFGDKITKVGSYVWIGRRVTIMPGANIGKGGVIGATSTVTKQIPEFCLAVGVPARVIKENISWCRTKDSFDEKSKNIISQLKEQTPDNIKFKIR